MSLTDAPRSSFAASYVEAGSGATVDFDDGYAVFVLTIVLGAWLLIAVLARRCAFFLGRRRRIDPPGEARSHFLSPRPGHGQHRDRAYPCPVPQDAGGRWFDDQQQESRFGASVPPPSGGDLQSCAVESIGVIDEASGYRALHPGQ